MKWTTVSYGFLPSRGPLCRDRATSRKRLSPRCGRPDVLLSHKARGAARHATLGTARSGDAFGLKSPQPDRPNGNPACQPDSRSSFVAAFTSTSELDELTPGWRRPRSEINAAAQNQPVIELVEAAHPGVPDSGREA
jgi:hypothetical protein